MSSETVKDAPGAQKSEEQSEKQPERARDYLELLGIDPRLLGMFAALTIIWLSFHFLTDGAFLSARNLWNLAVQTSVVAIIATGMVLVIITREIDLSVGSLLGFLGMVMAVLQTEILPEAAWTWLVALALGVVLGGGRRRVSGLLERVPRRSLLYRDLSRAAHLARRRLARDARAHRRAPKRKLSSFGRRR